MTEATGGYYLPHGSHWPIFGSMALFTMAIGVANYFQGAPWGLWVLIGGFAILVFMMFGWWGTVIAESESGAYNDQVDSSFRMGMAWFIVSEVFFFAGFFGALAYARFFSVEWLGGGDFWTSMLIWGGQSLSWPVAGPGASEAIREFEVMAAWPLATINTILLLSSSVTVTIAHHALKDNHRKKLNNWMFVTILCGLAFIAIQGYEFLHGWYHNMTLATGIYGSTFYMLTGFHGFHVTVGSLGLIAITGRCLKGHFSPTHDFGFAGVSWYWHFVDVVWLGLFVFVYILA